MIYYDNAATTIPYDEVIAAATGAIHQIPGNPSSIHRLGAQAEQVVRTARKQLGTALQCKENEIVFTSCATESINTVLKGFWEAYPRAEFRVVTSAAEHKATIECCAYLEKRGAQVHYLTPDRDGRISREQLTNALKPGVSLISLLHVNNETGAIADLSTLTMIRDAQCPNARIHIDAVQSFGKLPFTPSASGIDYASFSAHKIYGIKGAGAMFVKEGRRIVPLLHGGGQERALRSGTENVPAIAAFGVAAQIAHAGLAENAGRASAVKSVLLQRLTSGGVAFVVNSPADASPYILNLSFPGILPEVLIHALEAESMYISAASACASRTSKASHVLKAMGIRDDIARSAVRLSFGSANTPEEAATAATILLDVLARIPRHGRAYAGHLK
jgi:cysteine desulfurase